MLSSVQLAFYGSRSREMKLKTILQRLGAVSLLATTLVAGCAHHMQNTSSDGVPRKSPPLCFQYRGEARPSTGVLNTSNIWLMANNTCNYPIDCMIWNDVTEQESRIMLAPFHTNSYLLAGNQPVNRVSFKVECAALR